ncbi:TIGR02677 family protein [Allorhizocola rhizosphaerae]|uniref:TIGR02677 family protein n=1 Tax=Allorhizocola rhizosphaerae TaxID=1872709 RepID=UPI001FE5016E|nr:TIGR02677 family protein [Allorhizocola rhizosphaerae]
MSGQAKSSFGLDDFGLDDRMRLFTYVTTENRTAYLWVLRAFDAARDNYHVLLHTADVASSLTVLAAAHQDCPPPDDLELPRLLDALVEWGVLDRAQDGTRAATLAEYRNRHSVYQFTEAGYRAHRAVESVLSASLDDSNLSRLVFADLLADLAALAEANRNGDAEEVYRKLGRLDRALADVAERAARFYHMLGDLRRTNDVRPEVFLAHKDALLGHLRDFHDELQRYSPRLKEAVDVVESTGLNRLIEAAAEADERIFRTPAERLEDWRRRWTGLRSWLAPPGVDQVSEADRLADATIGAIGDVLALLRRVTEARRGGVSRESQLRHLAAWFTGVGNEAAAHALFDATFGLGAPRHVGVAYPDPEAIPTRRSWWDAPAVELSRTLVETGREPGSRNNLPARLDRAESGRARLREAQLAEERRLHHAARSLSETGLEEHILDEAGTALLLRLLDRVLANRPSGPIRVPVVASAFGVRLQLTPKPDTVATVSTTHGTLRIDGFALTVTPMDGRQ